MQTHPNFGSATKQCVGEGGVSLVCACVRVKHDVRETSDERFFSRVRAKSCLFLVVLDWRVAEEVDKPERLRKLEIVQGGQFELRSITR